MGSRVATDAQLGAVTFGVANFKAIASVNLAPQRLTLLAGANSSGKSSLLQALLFLAQSFSEPVPVLNGNLVRLGEPRDAMRDGGDDITLSFLYAEALPYETPSDPKEQYCLRLTFTEPDKTKQLAPSLFAQSCHCPHRGHRGISG